MEVQSQSAAPSQAAQPPSQEFNSTVPAEADASAVEFNADSEGPSIEEAIAFGKSAAGAEKPAETPAVEPAAVEAKPAEVREETPAKKQEEDERVGKRYADLHKRNKELFAREQSLKEREAKYQELESAIQNVKDDPAALLEMAGYKDVREFVERLAEDGGRLSPERRQLKEVQRQMEELRQERVREQQAREQERSAQEQRAAVDSVNKQIVEFIKNNESKYSLLSEDGGAQMIYREIEAHYQKTAGEDGVGEVLPLEKAVQAVNTRVEANLRKLVKNARVREILEDEALKSKSIQPGAASSKQPLKTITGAVRPGTSPAKAERIKNDEELLAEATAFLKQQAHSRK